MAISNGTARRSYGFGVRGGNVRPRVGNALTPEMQAAVAKLLSRLGIHPPKTSGENFNKPPSVSVGHIALGGALADKAIKPVNSAVAVETKTSTTDGLTAQPETPKNYWHGLALGMAELQERLRIAIEPEQ